MDLMGLTQQLRKKLAMQKTLSTIFLMELKELFKEDFLKANGFEF